MGLEPENRQVGDTTQHTVSSDSTPSTSERSAPPADRPPVGPLWHQLTAAAVAARLGVDTQVGLSGPEAHDRQVRYGSNTLADGRHRRAWEILLGQFADLMILLLVAAAVISGVIGEFVDAIAILVIVVLNGIVGFVQEYRAEHAIAALRLLAAPTAVTRRNGRSEVVPAVDLVPGDVVFLEAGNIVPADVRLSEVFRLKTNEAALTGESVPVEKLPTELSEADLPLGDRLNMAFRGTVVTYGRAVGLVVATGMSTEIGRIAALLHGTEDRQTPLQRRLSQFGTRLALAALGICAVVFVAGMLRGEPLVLMFLTAVSLAVAAIPEALPAVVTVSLALGARRLIGQQALIRRLPAVESLGSITVICSDKTGTLTQNRMRVETLVTDEAQIRLPLRSVPDREPWLAMFTALALSNDAERGDTGELRGDPTERALFECAEDVGFEKSALERLQPRRAELPFDAERKCMTTLHADPAGFVTFTKGAPEVIVPRCSGVLGPDGVRTTESAVFLAAAEELAAGGLRVLALAYRRWPTWPADMSPDRIEQDLTLIGLIGLLDPPRPEAAAAVAECLAAGIVPVMITGDHPATAVAIAGRVGIGGDGRVLTGSELSRLSPQALSQQVENVQIYARVAPEQKIDIVKALQERGQLVAMTGDGINDAPALKRADIGVAMGQSGTDVAREAAHMILLDDNFATIVAAVREGRRIFDNTRRFIRYAVTCNSGEIWTIFLAPFFGLPIPLLPIQLLWINLVTDGLPGLALAVEPAERGIMRRPPRPPTESIFAHGMWQHIIWVGLLMGGITIGTQAWAMRNDLAHWQTMVFTVLALSQMGHVLAIRSERDSLLTLGLFTNRPLLAAVLLTVVLQLLTIYVEALQPIFKTQPLSGLELAVTLAASAVIFAAVEIEKGLVRRGWLYRERGARGRRAAAATRGGEKTNDN